MPHKKVVPQKPVSKARAKDDHEKLLRLLIAFSKDPKVKFAELCFVSEKAAALKKYLDKERRYQWVPVGQCFYLYPFCAGQAEDAKAFIVKNGPRDFAWKLLNCHFHGRNNEGSCTTMTDAKRAVQEFFTTVEQ